MDRTDSAALSDLEDLLNAASAPLPDYTEALDGLRRHFNGSRACVQFYDCENIPTVCVNDANDTDFLEEAAEFEMRHMPPIIALLSAAEGDQPYLQSRLLEDSTIKRSPVWHSVMRRRDMFNGIGWKFDFAGAGWCMVDVQRGRHQEDFSGEDLETFKKLGRTLKRTSKGILEKTRAIDRNDRLQAIFDGLPCGMLTVDATMRVVDMNAVAARRFSEAGILVDEGRIRAANSNTQAILDDITARSLSGASTEPLRWQLKGSSGWISIEGRYLAKARFGRPLFCLLATGDDLRENASTESKLMARFGLSSREAAVAACIAQGLTPKQISQEFGTGITTVRTHLARVFAKTGATGQLRLALLVNNLSD